MYGSSGDLNDANYYGASAVTNMWYNGEVNAWTYYGLDNPPEGADLYAWGHFTALVWKGTTKLGCATVSCPAGTMSSMDSFFTVCNYAEPGNMGGAYGENVLEPLGQPTVTI